jgi:elongation factor G
MGELHLEIIVDRLKREFSVEANVGKPQVAYKETIRKESKAEGKYIKQTGGKGQYGHCKIELYPAPGEGFVFENDITGGTIPKEFIKPIEQGIKEATERGILAGYPVVDLRVTLYDGTYHEVDSSDMAFQIAASMGLQKVFMDASPILLEPIMNVEVTAPSEVTGDIIGDLNSRRGRIVGMEPAGETSVVRAQVPMAEMLTYESSLRSMSGGRGGYSMEFAHYEEVPAFLADKVIKEVKAEKEKAEKH